MSSRQDVIQTSFTSGETGPVIHGRVDLAKYFTGAKTIENFTVVPQGGLKSRSGTKFVAPLKDQTKQGVLVDFQFSDVQAYMLLFEENVIRVIRNEALIEDPPGTPVEIATTYTASQIQELDFANSADTLFITHADHPPRELRRSSHTDWTLVDYEYIDGPYLTPNETDIELSVDTTTITNVATIRASGGAFVAGDVGKYIEYNDEGTPKLALITAITSGTEVVVTPFPNILEPIDTEAVMTAGPTGGSLGNLESDKTIFNRSNVDHYIRYRVGTVVTGAAFTWGLVKKFIDNDTLQVQSLNQTTNAGTTPPVLLDNVVTCTINAIGGDVFVATDVDRKIRLNFGGQQVFGTIASYVSATQITASLKRVPPRDLNEGDKYLAEAKSKKWRLGAWSATLGYPRAVRFHQERLIFAGSKTEPQTFWGSKSGDFNNFSPTELDSTVIDSNAITATLADGEVNAIIWIHSGPVLLIGTIGGEWQIKPSNIGEALTAANIQATFQTSKGSALGQSKPLNVDSSTVFLQRSRTKLRRMIYNFDIDRWQANDINIISDHIFRDGTAVVDIAYQQEPSSIVWAVREDGQLIGLTYVDDQEVFAWHRHIVGGSFMDGEAIVESLGVIPSEAGTTESLYLIVKRTINGQTKRYVEVMARDFHAKLQTKSEMVFMDSALTYTGAPADIITGLDHLEGERVQVLIDGVSATGGTVIGGKLTIPYEGSVVTVGVAYEPRVELLPPETASNKGSSSTMKVKGLRKVTLSLLETIGFSYAQSGCELKEESFHTLEDAGSDSPALFTGVKPVDLSQVYDRNRGLVIVQTKPYPITIRSVSIEVEVYDDHR